MLELRNVSSGYGQSIDESAAPAKSYHADPIAADVRKDAEILNSGLGIFRNGLPWRQLTDIRQPRAFGSGLHCAALARQVVGRQGYVALFGEASSYIANVVG